jgi:hypothetical protein
MGKFIFTTTGLVPIVKFEGIGAYFNHPISAYTLSDYFDLNEIVNDLKIQEALDNNYITAVDENDNEITALEYLISNVPIFEIDQINNTTSYIGYGILNECKIQRIVTEKNGNYLSQWSEGNQNFDKTWGNRYNYNYI